MKYNLIPELNRALIGFDELFNQVNQTYPPYNILKTESGYQIELAVSGFDKSELTVTQKDHALEITGTKAKKGGEYVVQTLAYRNFKKVFQIHEGLEVGTIKHHNGVLVIDLVHTAKVDNTITHEIA